MHMNVSSQNKLSMLSVVLQYDYLTNSFQLIAYILPLNMV